MVILWTTFYLFNCQNQNFEYNCHTLCSQTIVQLNWPLNIYFILLLFLIYQTAVKSIQAFLIFLVIYSSIIVLCIFSVLDLKSPLNYFSSLILLIILFCASYLLNQRSLILKLVLRSDCKFPVGRVQTRHMDFLPPHNFGNLWKECQFLFHLSQSINWLNSRFFLQSIQFWSCEGKFLAQGSQKPIGLIPHNYYWVI